MIFSSKTSVSETAISSCGKRGGYTLVEMIIYVGIAAIIFTISVGALILISKTYKKVKAASAIEESAALSIDRIISEVRRAKTVDMSQSIMDFNPGKLVLNTTDSSGTPITIEFYIDNSVIHLKEGGIDSGPLTSQSARITNFVFRLSPNDNTTGIKIEMTIEAGANDSLKSDSFYNTAVLRNS